MTERDPQTQSPEDVQGVGELDSGTRATADGGQQGQITESDTGVVGTENLAVTDDGGIAVDGGKLPGNNDDFEDELREGPHHVPGADKKHHPAHAMSKGETKHLGI